MAGHKSERVAEDIRRELIAIIRELKDPRVAGKFLTVVRVAVTPDCSFAKVYISDIKGLDSAKEAVEALNGAKGRIQGEVTRHLRLRKAPELSFVADDSVEHGMKIIKELNALSEEKNESR